MNECKVGDRVQVCEGSWIGRTGAITCVTTDPHAKYVDVRFDDNGKIEPVVACTLEKLDD